MFLASFVNTDNMCTQFMAVSVKPAIKDWNSDFSIHWMMKNQ